MLKILIYYRMSITLARSVAMNYPLTTMLTRAGRSERKRPKKREKELQMLFVVVNLCIFEWYFNVLPSDVQ